LVLSSGIEQYIPPKEVVVHKNSLGALSMFSLVFLGAGGKKLVGGALFFLPVVKWVALTSGLPQYIFAPWVCVGHQYLRWCPPRFFPPKKMWAVGEKIFGCNYSHNFVLAII